MSAPSDLPTFASLYEAVGGEPTFRTLVDGFYRRVADDPVLRPMYPNEGLGPSADHLRLFLIQYWGGPQTYSETRGHPRLRMRHMPFSIGRPEREAWLRHMLAALDDLDLPPPLAERMREYFESASEAMMNRAEPA